MIATLVLLVASLSLSIAMCPSTEIRRIQNPMHQVTYSPPYSPAWGEEAPRLLIIGDVHGMLTELETLLEKAQYSTERGDRVIFAGDMINKGPESAGVLELGMRINASSVRGNHEDRVLRTWAGAEIARTLAEAEGANGADAVSEYKGSLSSDELDALETARTLSPEQRAWAASFPLVLRLGDLPGLGESAVVHAGMAPGLDIEDQDPWALYNVRTLLRLDKNGEFTNKTHETSFEEMVVTKLKDMSPGAEPSSQDINEEKKTALELYGSADGGFVPTDTNDGQWWVDVWNEVENEKPVDETLALFYGHDSKRGINIRDYSFGLDSRCVDGGKLTALVLTPDGNDGLKHHLVDVQCQEGE